MRYYRIEITDPTSGKLYQPPGFEGLLDGASYTSFVNGRTLPGAWNVVLDVPLNYFASGDGNAQVQIWGVSLAEISQANNLSKMNIAVYAGMQRGLPLANPAQAGLIVQGTIWQAFGNWIGTNMTLDLVIVPNLKGIAGGTGTVYQPKNIVLNWLAGQPLSLALTNALTTAFPGAQVDTQGISPNLVRPNDEVSYYQSVAELATYVKRASRAIIKTANYAGVDLGLSQNTFTASDGSFPNASNPTQIAFQDLIGQPTWYEGSVINFKTVMRADLGLGSQIKLPPTLITNTAATYSNLSNQAAAFQGGFWINFGRHIGDFRQPDASAWVSVFDAAPNNAPLAT